MPLPFAIPTIVSGFVGKWWKLGAGLVIGAALVFPLGQCSGAKNERNRAELAAANARTAAEARNSTAKDKSAEAQATTSAATQAAQERRDDEISKVPDSAPSDAERALNAERLRRLRP